MFFKRSAGLTALVLGFLGVAACVAGAYAVALIAARLQDANENVFSAVDRGLGAAEDHLRAAEKRVEESKITLSEIKQKSRDRVAGEAKDRIAEQLGIAAHAEKLSMQLQVADSWLATATESTRGVQQ